MILAGDIGGTKTVLALYRPDDRLGEPYRMQRYASAEYAGLEPIVAEFLASAGATPRCAAFGVAGPVVARRVETTNLPWTIDAAEMEVGFGIPRVDLLNDLQATAAAVPHLQATDVVTLHPGKAEAAAAGVIAVVAPGTGLGIAFLVPTEGGHDAFPTEGGHMSFGPCTAVESDLLLFLRQRFGHVSYERIASGSGLPNIYDFLLTTGRYPVPTWLSDALAVAADRTPVIVEAALGQRAEICVATLDLFVHVLGGVVGSAALLLMPTGGIYLGGGIPPRLLARLRQADFLEAIHAKGRSRAVLQRIPIHVMLDAEAALHGAVWHARKVVAEAPAGEGRPRRA